MANTRRAALAVILLALLPRLATGSPGDLDPSFGTAGITLTPIPDHDSFISRLALQPDGKIVASGVSNSRDTGVSGFLVMRFDADGSLDPGFGAGGIVTTTFESTAWANDVVIQENGKILVSGSARIDHRLVLTLARYDDTGALDPGFGNGGVVTTWLGGDFSARGMELQSDGRIVVAGSLSAVQTGLGLARFSSEGVLDPDFGAAGVVYTVIGNYSTAHALTVLADDSLVVAGDSGDDLLVVRYDADGELDPGFGAGGIVTRALGDYGSFNAIAVQSDGRLIVVGSTSLSGSDQLIVARYSLAGDLDPGFGDLGFFRANPELDSQGLDVVVQPDDRIIIGGLRREELESPNFSSSDFVLLRALPDGDLDPSFEPGGAPADDENHIYRLALQPDGFVLAAGFSGFHNLYASASDGVLARYDASLCGNGTVEGSETCDEADTLSGDGCDSNCTLTACGNGIVTAGEQCDGSDCCTSSCNLASSGTPCPGDGNPCIDDVCDASGHCGIVNPDPLPCDDSDSCTSNDQCSGGVCVGTSAVSCPACQACESTTGLCVDAIRGFCRAPVTPGSSKLFVSDSDDETDDVFNWDWKEGSATAAAEFADPTSTDAYDLCLYRPLLRTNDTPFALVWSASLPPGDLWRSRADKGFLYGDAAQSNAGISRLVLKSGGDGRARISLRAKGAAVETPDFSTLTTLPLILQLQHGNGDCWQSTLEDGRVRVNGARRTWRFVGQ